MGNKYYNKDILEAVTQGLVGGEPARSLDPFRLAKTTLILILLYANCSYSQELVYKTKPKFIGLLDANIEINTNQITKYKTPEELPQSYEIKCCDTTITNQLTKNGWCIGKCGNNCCCMAKRRIKIAKFLNNELYDDVVKTNQLEKIILP